MTAFTCRVRITNSKYTLSIPPFEVTAGNWPLAAHRASARALRGYKQVRGRRDRPIEIEVTVSQKRLKPTAITEERYD
jgi:hypothetical protein